VHASGIVHLDLKPTNILCHPGPSGKPARPTGLVLVAVVVIVDGVVVVVVVAAVVFAVTVVVVVVIFGVVVLLSSCSQSLLRTPSSEARGLRCVMSCGGDGDAALAAGHTSVHRARGLSSCQIDSCTSEIICAVTHHQH
jgi:serine/threonine protein kinase